MKALWAGFAVAAALALAGCYADLDWREYTSPEGRYSVLLPSKPALDARELTLSGARTTMHMVSAHAPEMAFGVGYADLPPGADPARVIEEGQAALVRNIAGRVTTERRQQAPVGVEFEAEGTAEGNPMRLAARLVVSDGRYYQVVFVGRAARTDEVDRTIFPGSFKLLPR